MWGPLVKSWFIRWIGLEGRWRKAAPKAKIEVITVYKSNFMSFIFTVDRGPNINGLLYHCQILNIVIYSVSLTPLTSYYLYLLGKELLVINMY